MKIESIELWRVAMPLVYPFRTAFGNTDTVESMLVRVVSEGYYGWGESAPWGQPGYSPECAATQFLVARDFLAPLLIDAELPDDPFAGGRALQERFRPVKGNFFAKAGFDLALWDLAARKQGRPLWTVLGGKSPEAEAGADFGIMESVDALLDTIAGAVERGYPRVKLKYRPGWELDMVEAVRTRFPKLPIHIDCNSAYTIEDRAMFRELDSFGLAMIEQPLAYDDLLDHAALQREITTPICLDESITSLEKARKAIAIGACRWVNIKPGRVGGITPALAIHGYCAQAGIPCWIGGMLESAVGASHCLALATLDNIRYPSDIFPSDRFFAEDLGRPPMAHSSPGRFRASDLPGIGVEPDPARLDAASVERAALGLA